MNEIRIDLEGMKENKELVKAWLDGAKIQIKFKDLNGIDTWYDCTEPEWHPEYDYRIRPTEKLRPFGASKLLCGAVIRLKSNHDIMHVITDQDDGRVYIGNEFFDRGELLERFEFLDGSPCGKLVEE